MNIEIRDYRHYKESTLGMLKALMKKLDRASTHKEFYSVETTHRILKDRLNSVEIEVQEDLNEMFIETLHNHPFRSMGLTHYTSVDTVFKDSDISKKIHFTHGKVSLQVFVNGSYNAIVVTYDTDKKEWIITESMFKRRKNPQMFVDYFTKLFSCLTVDYYNAQGGLK